MAFVRNFINGDTIDFMLRAKRDKNAVKAFFKKAIKSSGHPIKVNIDKSGSNYLVSKNCGVCYEDSKSLRMELWDNYYMRMPEQRRQSVERSII